MFVAINTAIATSLSRRTVHLLCQDGLLPASSYIASNALIDRKVCQDLSESGGVGGELFMFSKHQRTAWREAGADSFHNDDLLVLAKIRERDISTKNQRKDFIRNFTADILNAELDTILELWSKESCRSFFSNAAWRRLSGNSRRALSE